MNTQTRTLLAIALLAICASFALAANDPGHDSLYVLKIGDNVTGSINVTGNVTATLFRVTNELFGDYLDVDANGTILGAPSQPRIMAGSSQLYIDSTGNLYLNTKGGTSGIVQVGDMATNAITLNVSGTILQQNIQVCLQNGTGCPVMGGSSSAGGWTNTSNQVSLVNSANNVSAGTLFVDNTHGIVALNSGQQIRLNGVGDNNWWIGYVNSGGLGKLASGGITFNTYSAGNGFVFQDGGRPLMEMTSINNTAVFWTKVGINTTTPTQALEVNGSVNVSGTNAQVWVNGSVVCTASNGLCAGGGASSAGGWTNTSTTTSTGLDVNITARNSGAVPLTINAVSGQTVDLQEWKNSSGDILFNVYPSGSIAAPAPNSRFYIGSLNAWIEGSATGVFYIGSGGTWRQVSDANGNLFPYADGGGSLGKSDKRWSSLYVNGSGNFSGVDAQIWVNGSLVCTVSNGLCAGGGASSAGGWTNTSTTTSTALNVNASNFLFVNSTNVGIGTAFPATTFDLYGTASIHNPANGNAQTFGFTTNANNARMIGFTSGGSAGFDLLASGNSYFNGGNLGIGTTAPVSILDVNNTATSQPAVIVRGANGQSANLQEWKNYTGFTYAAISGVDGDAGHLKLYGPVGQGNGAGVDFTSNGSTFTGSVGIDGGGNLVLRQGNAGGMFFDYNSNVFFRQGGANVTLTLSSGNNLGIGTWPTQKLDVNGSVNVSGVDAQIWVNGSLVCTASNGLCAGGGTITGSGTNGNVPLWTPNGTNLGNSIITQSGSTLTVNGNISTPGNFYIGPSAVASGSNAVAVGASAGAVNTSSSAFGNAAYASGIYAVAIGATAVATGSTSSALGYNAQATGASSSAVGNSALASGGNSLSIGFNSQATGASSSAFGNGAIANGNYATAIGYFPNASGTYATAIGYQAAASGSSNAIGYQASAAGGWATAIGNQANASGQDGIAIGRSANALPNYGIAIGYTTTAGDSAVALGYLATAATGSNAIGSQASVTGSFANAIGGSASAGGGEANAIGYQANAAGTYATAIGYQANASYQDSVAIGLGATTTAANQFVIGNVTPSYNINTKIFGTLDAYDVTINGTHISGGGGTVFTGSGTAGTVPLYVTNGTNFGDSIITQSGNTLTINGNITTTDTFWIGNGASAAGYGSVALGSGAHATAVGASAFGLSASATSAQATAIGYVATAQNTSAVALGDSAHALGQGSIAIGQAQAGAFSNAISIGGNSFATADTAVAVGASAKANGSSGVALGPIAIASGASSVAVGVSASAYGVASTAFGSSASAKGDYATALGLSSSANGTSAVAIGQSSALADNAIAIGSAVANSLDTIAIGTSAYPLSPEGIAIGTHTSTSNYGIAIGYYAAANYNNSVAIGRGATTNGVNQFVVGSSSIPLNGTIYGTLDAYDVTINGTHISGGGTPLTGSGAAGNLTMWQTNSTNLAGSVIYQSGSNVGIGTNAPHAALDVVGQVNITKGNVTVEPGNGMCFNANCSVRMYYNGTALVIQG